MGRQKRLRGTRVGRCKQMYPAHRGRKGNKRQRKQRGPPPSADASGSDYNLTHKNRHNKIQKHLNSFLP